MRRRYIIANKLLKILEIIIPKIPLLGTELRRERYREETGRLSRAGKSKNLFGKSGR